MAADLKAARERLAQIIADEDRTKKSSPRGYRGTAVVEVEDLRTLLTALDQAAEALAKAGEDLNVIHRAASYCQGKFGGRMSEVDRVFQEIARVSSMHKARAATVYATLKPEGDA